MSFPHHDVAWQAVADFLQQRAKRSDRLLAPDPFRLIFLNARGYADTYFDPAARYDWIVLHKDEMLRVRRSFLATLLDVAVPVCANEVFVVLAEARPDLPGLGGDDPHVTAFLKRRSGLMGRDHAGPRSREEKPSCWFATTEVLDDALHFLDEKIRADRQDGAGPQQAGESGPEVDAMAARDGMRASGIPPLQVAPTSRPAMAATVVHPIGDIRRMLEDTRIRGFRPRGLVDVGANVGEWTRLALSVFPDLAFVLIEPQQELADRLMALVADRPECHYVAAGAGRAAGEAIQTISEDPGASSFLPTPDAAGRESGRQRQTRIIALDDLFRPGGLCQAMPPDLVKMDVQGFEMEVLAGADTLFGRTELFIIETSLYEFMPRQPLAREVITFMASRGYEIYDIPEFGRRPYDGALGQVDFAFVPREGLLRSTNAW